MLKMAPPQNPSRLGGLVMGTWIVGVYLLILISLGFEVRHKPGVPHRQTAPEARELFSLR